MAETTDAMREKSAEGTNDAPAAQPVSLKRPHAGSARSSGGRTVLLLAMAVLVLMIGGAVTGALVKTSDTGVTPSQLAKAKVPVPASQGTKVIPASNAAVLGLQKLHGASAPNFVLTDQHGQVVSLAQLVSHHAVVLAFMDDRCRDICPLVAQELVDAYHDLGPQAGTVDFVSVNLNATYGATSWLRAFIAEHGLGTLPDFYYVTGSPAALRTVWSHYGITVETNPKTNAVYHSEAMYFIRPGGHMAYQATPFANMRPNGTGWLPAATITQWGKGIAQYAKAVLQ